MSPLVLSAPDWDATWLDTPPRGLPCPVVSKHWNPPTAWFHSLRSEPAARALADALPWNRKRHPPGNRSDWLGVLLPQWGAQFYLRRCLP